MKILFGKICIEKQFWPNPPDGHWGHATPGDGRLDCVIQAISRLRSSDGRRGRATLRWWSPVCR